MVWSAEIEAFVEAHICDDVRRLALGKNELKGEELRMALSQIELRQRMMDKLPRMSARRGVVFPTRLATEQCSSEVAAAYKRDLLGVRCKKGVDMTGGLGVDALFLSDLCDEMTFVERDQDLCEAAIHNMRLLADNVKVVRMTAEQWLDLGEERFGFGFIDPARRGGCGEKVFRIEDCSPDVRGLRDKMLARCERVLVKLSPMLDVKECIEELMPSLVVVVSVDNECKEVLALLDGSVGECAVRAVELRKEVEVRFDFRYSDEECCATRFAERLEPGMRIYEPYAAMMKCGAWRLMGERFGARMIAPNSHLYVGEGCFPGRGFEVVEVCEFSKREAQRLLSGKANVAVRNFPMSVAEVRRRFRCADGGGRYLFLTTDHEGRKLIVEGRRL